MGNPFSIASLLQCSAQLIRAVKANDVEEFKTECQIGVTHFDQVTVAELLDQGIPAFLTEEERDRMIAWTLGVSL